MSTPYVELDPVNNGNLKITLTDVGREVVAAMRAGHYSEWAMLYELLEWHLCNGWEWVRPEDIGALTAAPILEHDGMYWWHERYQIEDAVERMERDGYVIFERGN